MPPQRFPNTLKLPRLSYPLTAATRCLQWAGLGTGLSLKRSRLGGISHHAAQLQALNSWVGSAPTLSVWAASTKSGGARMPSCQRWHTVSGRRGCRHSTTTGMTLLQRLLFGAKAELSEGQWLQAGRRRGWPWGGSAWQGVCSSSLHWPDAVCLGQPVCLRGWRWGVTAVPSWCTGTWVSSPADETLQHPALCMGPCSTPPQNWAWTSSTWQLCSIRAVGLCTAHPLSPTRPQPQAARAGTGEHSSPRAWLGPWAGSAVAAVGLSQTHYLAPALCHCLGSMLGLQPTRMLGTHTNLGQNNAWGVYSMKSPVS